MSRAQRRPDATRPLFCRRRHARITRAGSHLPKRRAPTRVRGACSASARRHAFFFFFFAAWKCCLFCRLPHRKRARIRSMIAACAPRAREMRHAAWRCRRRALRRYFTCLWCCLRRRLMPTFTMRDAASRRCARRQACPPLTRSVIATMPVWCHALLKKSFHVRCFSARVSRFFFALLASTLARRRCSPMMPWCSSTAAPHYRPTFIFAEVRPLAARVSFRLSPCPGVFRDGSVAVLQSIPDIFQRYGACWGVNPPALPPAQGCRCEFIRRAAFLPCKVHARPPLSSGVSFHAVNICSERDMVDYCVGRCACSLFIMFFFFASGLFCSPTRFFDPSLHDNLSSSAHHRGVICFITMSACYGHAWRVRVIWDCFSLLVHFTSEMWSLHAARR